MGKLMNKCAYTVSAVAHLLVGAGIAVKHNAIKHICAFSTGLNLPGMGPHSIVSATVSLSSAGVEDKYIVDISVAIAVILREVHLVVEQATGIDNHFVGIAVISGKRVVTSVVGTLMWKLHRSVDIKFGQKLPVGTFHEEVAGRTGATVVGESRLVEHT